VYIGVENGRHTIGIDQGRHTVEPRSSRPNDPRMCAAARLGPVGSVDLTVMPPPSSALGDSDEVSGVASDADLRAAIVEAEQRWRDHRPAAGYRFRLTEERDVVTYEQMDDIPGYETPELEYLAVEGTRSIDVAGNLGTVVAGTGGAATIDGLFDRLHGLIDDPDSPNEFTIEFDHDLGIPVRIVYGAAPNAYHGRVFTVDWYAPK
jgi:hypothetical protein